MTATMTMPAAGEAAPAITAFRQLLDPFPVERFLTEVHRRKPLHVPAPDPGRFSGLMSWEALTLLLNQQVWTPSSMQLVMDKRKVPPQAFCRPGVDRNGQQAMQPDARQLTELMRQGAALVLENIDTLWPPVRDAVRAVEAALGGKAAANLYCSWKARQGFDSHYDRHDVYALQIIGEKRWRIYEGRAETPIEHPAFRNIPQADYDRMKGRVAEEITAKPGDLLYLPRGQFHDAIATDMASIHIPISCTEPTGIDLVTQLWHEAVKDAVFRADLPAVGEGDAALGRHLEDLGGRLAAMLSGERGLALAKGLRRGFGVPRHDLGLPALDIPRPVHVRAVGHSLEQRGGDWVLVLPPAGEVRLPAGAQDPVRWILDQGSFDLADLHRRFPLLQAGFLESLLGLLERHEVVVPR